MWTITRTLSKLRFVNTDSGERAERRLNHSDGEAENFYRELKAAGFSVFKKALDTPNIVRDGRITANLPDVLGRTVQKPVSGNSQISTARE